MLTNLRSIRHIALDMDGTIYKGGTLFSFTREFLSRMDALGIGYTFLTNNSSKSVKDYLQHLRHMDIEAHEGQMYTSTLSTIDYLHERLPGIKSLFVLGTPSLQEEFRQAGYTVVEGHREPEAVIIGFDTALVYPRLCEAAWWIQQGKPYIATHPDRVCPTDQPTVLVDCGAVCACLTSATGRSPDAVLGKPDPRMLTGILARHGLEPRELLMAGDRIYTDMAMAHRARAMGVLVLTGEATADDVETCPEKPDLVVPSLKELADLLMAAKEKRA